MNQAVIKEWLHDFYTKDRYTFYATALLVCAGVSFGGFKAYKTYIAQREMNAQIAMAESFEEYEKVIDEIFSGKLSPEVIDQRLEDAQIGFESVINKHGSAYLTSYVHAFQADVLWQSGKKEEALSFLEKAIKTVSYAPLKNTLLTKKALMRIDLNQPEGLKELSALATDPHNSYGDYAAYQLGYYYWSMHDLEQARAAWKNLERFASDTRPEGRSPWLDAAQEKLNFLS